MFRADPGSDVFIADRLSLQKRDFHFALADPRLRSLTAISKISPDARR